MAMRPVFIPQLNGKVSVQTRMIEFEWFPGFAVSQKQKSIDSLHRSVTDSLGIEHILEISSKSKDELGKNLSSFNLMISTKRHRMFSVESAYQSSKVFEYGGPYLHLLDSSSLDAKREPKLRTSGNLCRFSFFGEEWDLEPKTAFYDWLYVNALSKNDKLASAITSFQAFTDIEFNPRKSFSCQAFSAALFVSLVAHGIRIGDLKSRNAFLDTVAYETTNDLDYGSHRQETLW